MYATIKSRKEAVWRAGWQRRLTRVDDLTNEPLPEEQLCKPK